jgi:hypothetical protein
VRPLVQVVKSATKVQLGVAPSPKQGLTGFSVSKLWGSRLGQPAHMASALAIMTEGPLGGAAFNNEFGRPNLLGYFREYEQVVDGVQRGYHKPIMIAGGLGVVQRELTRKIEFPPRHFVDSTGRARHAHWHGRRCCQFLGQWQQQRGFGL